MRCEDIDPIQSIKVVNLENTGQHKASKKVSKQNVDCPHERWSSPSTILLLFLFLLLFLLLLLLVVVVLLLFLLLLSSSLLIISLVITNIKIIINLTTTRIITACIRCSGNVHSNGSQWIIIRTMIIWLSIVTTTTYITLYTPFGPHMMWPGLNKWETQAVPHAAISMCPSLQCTLSARLSIGRDMGWQEWCAHAGTLQQELDAVDAGIAH